MKPSSAIKALGCSISQLKEHIESLFFKDMTWENQGKWHVDHIRPLVSFNLQDPKEFNEACHFTNLQPIMVEDNLKKNSTWEATKYECIQ